ncbi:hypothetical protein TNCV_1027851 [Trichonephila clavipes]|nr:hypothetical protein TNCV_1027851 [Trichonephila clavipes]
MITLNTFTATIGQGSNHCNSSRRNEFFSTCRLKEECMLMIYSSRDSTELAIKALRASTGFGSRVDVMSRDGARFSSVNNLSTYIGFRFIGTRCSLLAALNTSKLHNLAVAHGCSNIQPDYFVLTRKENIKY